jgi:hypothetical protein
MRIASFVGTRPEINKNLAFCRAAATIPDLEFLVFHSAQNFGPDMADCFIEQLNISIADQNPGGDRSTPGHVAPCLIDYSRQSMERYRPDVIISNTDTYTAFYSALAATQLRIPVAHFEGGIRCEARLNPEEIDRRLADHLSGWVFTISDQDSRALAGEGFPPERIFMLGNIALDALRIILHGHGIAVRRGDYDVVTTHRQENANDPTWLAAIIDAVESAGFPTISPNPSADPRHPPRRRAAEPAGALGDHRGPAPAGLHRDGPPGRRLPQGDLRPWRPAPRGLHARQGGDLARLVRLVQADDFAATAEILLRAWLAGARMVEFSAANARREHGVSETRVLRVSLNHLRLALRTRFGRLPPPASIEDHPRRISVTVPA